MMRFLNESNKLLNRTINGSMHYLPLSRKHPLMDPCLKSSTKSFIKWKYWSLIMKIKLTCFKSINPYLVDQPVKLLAWRIWEIYKLNNECVRTSGLVFKGLSPWEETLATMLLFSLISRTSSFGILFKIRWTVLWGTCSVDFGSK